MINYLTVLGCCDVLMDWLHCMQTLMEIKLLLHYCFHLRTPVRPLRSRGPCLRGVHARSVEPFVGSLLSFLGLMLAKVFIVCVSPDSLGKSRDAPSSSVIFLVLTSLELCVCIVGPATLVLKGLCDLTT